MTNQELKNERGRYVSQIGQAVFNGNDGAALMLRHYADVLEELHSKLKYYVEQDSSLCASMSVKELVYYAQKIQDFTCEFAAEINAITESLNKIL